MPELATSAPGRPAHQFDDLDQQREADRLGMWAFLTTEVLLFGGLFLGYTVYRALYGAAWVEGAGHNSLAIGTANTAVLLLSSFTVALAVKAAEEEAWRSVVGFLGATGVLGGLFLGLKFYEYYLHWQEGYVPGLHFDHAAPHLELFFLFYFLMTGLHALHMLIGLGIWTVVGVLAWRRKLPDAMPVEVAGLYWHFVDIVWVFLYPLFYLLH